MSDAQRKLEHLTCATMRMICHFLILKMINSANFLYCLCCIYPQGTFKKETTIKSYQYSDRETKIYLCLYGQTTQVSRFKNWKLAVQSKLGPPSTKLGWPSTYIQYCAGVPLWIRNYNSWNGGSIQNTWTASLMVYFSLNSRVS